MSDSVEHATWTAKRENFLTDMLHEETKKGLHSSTLDNKTWLKIENELAAKFGVYYMLAQLKAKWNRLRIATKDFDKLNQRTRFGWDLEFNIVTATENVWKNYLEKYLEGKKYKKKGLAKYDVPSEIFGGTIATGKRAMGPHTAAKNGGATNKSVQEVEPKEETGDFDDILNTPPAKVKPSEGGNGCSKKKSATKSLVESIQRWSKSQATKNEAFVRAQEEFYYYISEK